MSKFTKRLVGGWEGQGVGGVEMHVGKWVAGGVAGGKEDGKSFVSACM